MKIFITGATGFVGTKLVQALLEQDHQIFALVRSVEKAGNILKQLPLNAGEKITFLYGDITDKGLGVNDEEKAQLIGNIDVFYHSAAYLSFDPTEREKTFNINVEGTRNVLEFAKDINVKKFFHVSTAYKKRENCKMN